MKKLLLETSFSKIYIIVMILISILVVGGYFSYAMFTVTKEKSNAISIVTGSLTYKLEVDGEESTTLIVPAKSSKEFIVNLTNPNNRVARFNFYYIDDLIEGIDAGYIKSDGYNITPIETGINLEKSGSSGSSNVYLIRVDNTTDKEITIELGVDVGLDYNDLSLPSNGHLFEECKYIINYPDLDEAMIPVSYSGSNWVKADVNNIGNSWYNYDELKWANAVTVSSSTREKYLNASIGTVVSIDDIETMWVWIPRYSYSIGSEDGTNYYGKQGEFLSTIPTQSSPGEIDVRFVSTSVKDRGTAKYLVKAGIVDNSWYTPDAFTFNNKELSGIWVGKFETSSSNPSASYGGENTTELDPLIRPNVISWRSINVSNAFNVSLKMNDDGNRYGFSSDVDTHMMKNSEWAIVSYLSQSKYGKLGNVNFSGANKEIYQNKSNSYITGCSYGKPGSANGLNDFGCHYKYNTSINGTGASTTGNIYGVYDMSGSAWEYVMGNYNDNLGRGSGFSNMPDSIYYDKYTNGNIDISCSGGVCLSHALSEISSWYGDSYIEMFLNDYPWLLRGGDTDPPSNQGAFALTNSTFGGPQYNISFRLVLSLD